MTFLTRALLLKKISFSLLGTFLQITTNLYMNYFVIICLLRLLCGIFICALDSTVCDSISSIGPIMWPSNKVYFYLYISYPLMSEKA